MKYKIGDRVRVRADLKENERYGGLRLYAPYMSRFRGKEFIISSVREDDNKYGFAGNIYTWPGEMLEPASPATPDWTLIVRPDKKNPDKTTAILKVDGKETRRESVKRYYKDKYNSGAAIREVVAKLLDPNGCAVAEGTLKPASDAIKADEPVIGPPANNTVHKKQYTLTITDNGDNIRCEGTGNGQFNAHEILAALEYHKYALMAQTANVMDIKTGGKI